MYINMQLVFVTSGRLFTSAPRRYALEPHNASPCDALHLSPAVRPAMPRTQSSASGGARATRLPSAHKASLSIHS